MDMANAQMGSAIILIMFAAFMMRLVITWCRTGECQMKRSTLRYKQYPRFFVCHAVFCAWLAGFAFLIGVGLALETIAVVRPW